MMITGFGRIQVKELIPKEKIFLLARVFATFRAAKEGRIGHSAVERSKGLKICNFSSGMVYISESAEEGSFEWRRKN